MDYDFEGKLPVRIKIGSEVFSVVWWDIHTLVNEKGEELLGQTEPDEHILNIEREQDVQSLMDTVRHEITHAANKVYGVKDRMTEEDVTDRTTKAWNDIWIHNPKLVVWFDRAAKHVRKLQRLKG